MVGDGERMRARRARRGSRGRVGGELREGGGGQEQPRKNWGGGGGAGVQGCRGASRRPGEGNCRRGQVGWDGGWWGWDGRSSHDHYLSKKRTTQTELIIPIVLVPALYYACRTEGIMCNLKLYTKEPFLHSTLENRRTRPLPQILLVYLCNLKLSIDMSHNTPDTDTMA